MEKYVLHKKSNLTKIKISDLEGNLPDLKNISTSKAVAIAKWLVDRIKNDNNIQAGNILPAKPDLAYLLGVSIGTVQSAYRFVEDLGYAESKQCLGTIVIDRENSHGSLRKHTSKRDIAIASIKKYILDNNIQPGQFLPAPSYMSAIIDSSTNTTRIALENLCINGTLEHRFKCEGKCGWVVKSTDFAVEKTESTTLVEKIEQDLKNYITKNLKVGDRVPAHGELITMFSASMKTIHDALQTLIKEKILLPRRGKYGTIVIKMPQDKTFDEKKETSIFASAPETSFYYYEKTQNHIKKMISEKYEIGSKLPSVDELAKELDISPNTIRKAFHNLAKEGYLTFSRGRYGGTYITDIPDEQSFKWLAVNPKYAEEIVK